MSSRKRTRSGDRGALTQDAVVTAALEFIDTHGEARLTMRALADAIGVFPTTIYWHAGNRATLLAAVCERVFSEIELPPGDGAEWDDWIRSMASEVRRTIFAHPNLAATISSQMQVTPSSFPFIESVLSVLDAAGFRDTDIAGAYNTVINSVFGFVFAELASEPSGAEPNWATGFRERLDQVDPDTTPVLAKVMPHVAGEALMLRWESGRTHPLDDSFEFAVSVLIDGLRARLRSAQPPARRGK